MTYLPDPVEEEGIEGAAETFSCFAFPFLDFLFGWNVAGAVDGALSPDATDGVETESVVGRGCASSMTGWAFFSLQAVASQIQAAIIVHADRFFMVQTLPSERRLFPEFPVFGHSPNWTFLEGRDQNDLKVKKLWAIGWVNIPKKRFLVSNSRN